MVAVLFAVGSDGRVVRLGQVLGPVSTAMEISVVVVVEVEVREKDGRCS